MKIIYRLMAVLFIIWAVAGGVLLCVLSPVLWIFTGRVFFLEWCIFTGQIFVDMYHKWDL